MVYIILLFSILWYVFEICNRKAMDRNGKRPPTATKTQQSNQTKKLKIVSQEKQEKTETKIILATENEEKMKGQRQNNNKKNIFS